MNNTQRSFAEKAKRGITPGGKYANGLVPMPARAYGAGSAMDPHSVRNAALLSAAQPPLTITNGMEPETVAPGALTITNGMEPEKVDPNALKITNGMARGGIVKGKGTRTSDSVPVHLSKDEAVLPGDTVDAMGGPDAVERLIEDTTGAKPSGVKAGGEYRDGALPGDDFRTRAAGRTGFFGPDGKPARGFPTPPPAPVTPQAPSGTGFFTPDGAGSKAFGQQMGMEVTGPSPSAPPNSGPQKPWAPNVGPQKPWAPNVGPQMPAPANSGPQRPPSFVRDLRSGANRLFSGGAAPDWRGMGRSVAAGAKRGLGNALGSINTLTNTVGAGNDLGMIAAAPHAGTFEKLGAGAEALGNVAVGGLEDAFLKGRGFIMGTGGAVANQAANSRPITQLARALSPNGRSGIDNIRSDNFGEDSAPSPFSTLGQLAKRGLDQDVPTPVSPTAPSAPSTAPTAGVTAAPADELTKSTFGSEGNPNPFERAATPAAELARQSSNFDKYEGALNNGLAERVKASSGGTSFGDETAQALFNAKQQLNGSGISVTKGANGTPEFSGNNVNGQGGKLYTAADGSITNDWSKTKNYAEAIQRNKDDQTKLAELTRGAALSGDKDAVARLTYGDGKLQAIAAEGATTRDLREAVKNGNTKAGDTLANMQKAQSDQSLAGAELALRAEDIRGRAEDRDLDRSFKAGAQKAAALSAQRATAKDARDFEVGQNEKLDKQLEQYATFDGKLDGQRLSHLRGLTANLKRSEGQTEEQFAADRSTLLNLDANLENGQAFYDKWFRKDGGAGTDMRRWRTNPGLRGGFTTDQGEHMSTGQFRSLPADQQRMFRELLLKDGK